jgi:hypothetical protein
MFGINNVGDAVGYIQGPVPGQGDISHGVFLPDLHLQPSQHMLNVPGATGTVCRGINDAGVICGYATWGDGLGAERAAFVTSHGTFSVFGFPGASWTQAHGINNPLPAVASTSFDVVGFFGLPTDPATVRGHGFLATLSPPHVVKWDGGAWAELELETGAMIRHEGEVAPNPF